MGQLAKVLFILLMVVIPVPLQLFYRPARLRRGAESGQVLKKE